MFAFLTSMLSGCVAERAATKLVEVVKYVDANKYQGTWYEIARFPHFFQKGCVSSMAEYKVIDETTLSVENKCFMEGYNGREKSIKGKARIVENSNGAKLKVRFNKFPTSLFEGDYWITMLDENYNWAVVTDSKGAYLWILSRQQKMSDSLYNTIKTKLSERGFKVDLLKKY